MTERPDDLRAPGSATVSAITVLAGTALLSACMAPNYMALETSSYAMTADKRVIISVPAAGDPFSNANKPSRIVCPEPSPDVAKAVSRAIEAMVVAERSTAAGDKQAARGSFSSTAVESLVQLGQRTVTIQALRDEYADLCRTYANGAINSTSYTIRLARLDRKMMSMHTSEMIAGNFGGRLASISGSATGTAGHSSVIKAGEDLDKALTGWKSACAGAGQSCKAEDPAAVKTLAAAHENEFRTVMAYVRGVNVGLSSTATPAEPPSRAPSTAPPADALVAVQSAFLDKSDLPILVDACVTALDYAKPQNPRSAAQAEAIVATLDAKRAQVELRGAKVLGNDMRAVPPIDAEIDRLDKKLATDFDLYAKSSESLSDFGKWCSKELRGLLSDGISEATAIFNRKIQTIGAMTAKLSAATRNIEAETRSKVIEFCIARSRSRPPPAADPNADAICTRVAKGEHL